MGKVAPRLAAKKSLYNPSAKPQCMLEASRDLHDDFWALQGFIEERTTVRRASVRRGEGDSMKCEQDVDDIHLELVSENGMSVGRRAIAASYAQLFHRTRIENFESIVRHGLLAKPQAPATGIDMGIVDSVFGTREILCLSPRPSFYRDTLDDPRLTLAITIQSLPQRIGLDWSFEYPWRLAELLRCTNPRRDCGSILVEVVQRSGSLAAYGAISSGEVRVLTKADDRQRPDTWPIVTHVELADLTED